jgi:alkylation response protein AidB-like acyl-CoA dehydrogenase
MNNVASETISLNVDYIRARVSGLLGDIQERSAEIEAARRLPADLVTALKRAGVFRMPVPRSWGGPEMTPREQVDIIELLSAADPSVGWCVMIGSDAGYYSAFLTTRSADRCGPT